MTPSTHTLLVAIVDRTEETGEPVGIEQLAASMGASEPALEEPIEALCECDLVESIEGGYRPTVTAHELLALDVDFEDVLVVDVVEE